MSRICCENREMLIRTLETLKKDDCVELARLSDLGTDAAGALALIAAIGERGAELVLREPPFDTRQYGGGFFSLCRALLSLDGAEQPDRRRAGIERAKAEGKYRGRKPIAVDERAFESVVALWQNGEITARQAMARLDLKPNTFYRRIKEWEEHNMKDYKQAEHEIRAELREAAKESRRELGELKKQVRAEAKEIKKAAGEKLELHDVERELRKDRLRAEAEHIESVRQMKRDVEAESRELKKMLEE